jgi:hypothetical protein
MGTGGKRRMIGGISGVPTWRETEEVYIIINQGKTQKYRRPR